MKTFLLLALLVVVSSQNSFGQYKFYEDGLLKYKAGEYDATIDLLTQFLSKSIRDKKFDADAHYYRGLAYFKKSDYVNAVPDLKEAIALNHENTGNIYWFLAKAYMRSDQPELALQEYSNAIQRLQTDKTAHSKLLFERGQIYEKMNNPSAAFKDLTLATSLNPNDESIKQELDKLNKQTRSGKQENLASSTKKEEKSEPVREPGTKQTPANSNTQNPLVTLPATEAVQDLRPEANQQADEQSALAAVYANEKRYALIIGNSAYPKEIGALRNPVNDATDLAKELQNSNFEVQLLTNVTYVQMREAMRKFNEKLTEGPKDQTVGLFYYAGHGVQHEEENYMVPIDAKVEFEDDIPRMCFPVQRMVLANMERSNSRMNIVVLDACRNNPFPSATRSVSQGLGEMRRARGSFIAYATSPGSVASDGTGRNGLYTQELLKALRKPGLTIEQVFKEVRANVLRLSGDKQNTWDSSNIIGEFYFKF